MPHAIDSNSLLTDVQAREVRHAATEAGQRIMGFLNNPARLRVEQKPDGSKVTSADYDADTYLKAALSRIAPSIPILSEEDDLATQRAAITGGTYWCIDPLDGTGTAVRYADDIEAGRPTDKNHFFGVLVSLIKEGKPVYGVAHYPMMDGGVTYFTNGAGTESFVQYKEHVPTRLVARPTPFGGKLTASIHWSDSQHRFISIDGDQPRIAGRSIDPIKLSGSRILQVAEGKADLGFMEHDAMHCPGYWDIAALQAIAAPAGAKVVAVNAGAAGAVTAQATRQAKELRYDLPADGGAPFHGHCLVGSLDALRQVGVSTRQFDPVWGDRLR